MFVAAVAYWKEVLLYILNQTFLCRANAVRPQKQEQYRVNVSKSHILRFYYIMQ